MGRELQSAAPHLSQLSTKSAGAKHLANTLDRLRQRLVARRKGEADEPFPGFAERRAGDNRDVRLLQDVVRELQRRLAGAANVREGVEGAFWHRAIDALDRAQPLGDELAAAIP